MCLVFLGWLMMFNRSLHMWIGHYVFEEMSVQVLCPFLKCAVFSLNCQNLGEILGEVLYQIFSILKVVFTILMMFLEVYKLVTWLDLVVCTSTPNTQKAEAPKLKASSVYIVRPCLRNNYYYFSLWWLSLPMSIVLLMWMLRNHDQMQTQENQCLFSSKNFSSFSC